MSIQEKKKNITRIHITQDELNTPPKKAIIKDISKSSSYEDDSTDLTDEKRADIQDKNKRKGNKKFKTPVNYTQSDTEKEEEVEEHKPAKDKIHNNKVRKLLQLEIPSSSEKIDKPPLSPIDTTTKKLLQDNKRLDDFGFTIRNNSSQFESENHIKKHKKVKKSSNLEIQSSSEMIENPPLSQMDKTAKKSLQDNKKLDDFGFNLIPGRNISSQFETESQIKNSSQVQRYITYYLKVNFRSVKSKNRFS